MAEDFDARAAAQDLAQSIATTRAEVRQAVPPATPVPLFHKLQDGSVTDNKGNVILPAPKPAPAKS